MVGFLLRRRLECCEHEIGRTQSDSWRITFWAEHADEKNSVQRYHASLVRPAAIHKYSICTRVAAAFAAHKAAIVLHHSMAASPSQPDTLERKIERRSVSIGKTRRWQ